MYIVQCIILAPLHSIHYSTAITLQYTTVISNHTTTHQTLYIVSAGKTAHFLLNFTRNKIN